MKMTHTRSELTGPGVLDPQGPAGSRFGSSLPPSSSHDELAAESSAGSAVVMATADVLDVSPGTSRGTYEVPRVLCVERGVFLRSRKRKKTAPLEPDEQGEEARAADVNITPAVASVTLTPIVRVT